MICKGRNVKQRQKLHKTGWGGTWLLLLLLSMISFGSPSFGHEAWLSPQAYIKKSDMSVRADIRIGQNFTGDGLRYLPQKIATLAFLTQDGQQAITGRLGDQPAIQATAPIQGQNILIYQSQPEKIVYQNFDKFADFVREKADESLLNTHQQRGLPEKDFTETYIRFAKTILIRGTDAPGLADRYSGMEVEFVAENDTPQNDTPHNKDTRPLSFRLFYQGKPLAGAKVTIFEKGSDGKIFTENHRTDAQARVYLKPKSGHEYLIDHVTIRPPLNGKNPMGAAWESLWASITFYYPQ